MIGNSFLFFLNGFHRPLLRRLFDFLLSSSPPSVEVKRVWVSVVEWDSKLIAFAGNGLTLNPISDKTVNVLKADRFIKAKLLDLTWCLSKIPQVPAVDLFFISSKDFPLKSTKSF